VVRVPVMQHASGEPIHTTRQNGELRCDHPYLTAVVRLRQSEPNEQSATAFIPSSPTAVTLPDVFFRGPRDRVLAYSFDRQAYVAVHDSGAA
jgi:hypothetical protein